MDTRHWIYRKAAEIWVFAAIVSLSVVVLLPALSSGCGRGGYTLYATQDQASPELFTEQILYTQWEQDPTYDPFQASRVSTIYISIRDDSVFGVFRSWIHEIGNARIRLPSDSTDEDPTDAEYYGLIQRSAIADLQSATPSAEYLYLQSSGILAAMQTPSGKQYRFQPLNILYDFTTFLAIAITLCCIVYLIKSSIRSKDPNRCPACNYPKAGLPHKTTRCPECGTPFTQASPLIVFGAEIKSAR